MLNAGLCLQFYWEIIKRYVFQNNSSNIEEQGIITGKLVCCLCFTGNYVVPVVATNLIGCLLTHLIHYVSFRIL